MYSEASESEPGVDTQASLQALQAASQLSSRALRVEESSSSSSSSSISSQKGKELSLALAAAEAAVVVVAIVEEGEAGPLTMLEASLVVARMLEEVAMTLEDAATLLAATMLEEVVATLEEVAAVLEEAVASPEVATSLEEVAITLELITSTLLEPVTSTEEALEVAMTLGVALVASTALPVIQLTYSVWQVYVAGVAVELLLAVR